MKAESKPKKVVKTFPDELYIYEKRAGSIHYNWKSIKILTAAKDVESVGNARGREVGVYKLVKVVRAQKKTVVSVSVSDTE